MSPLLSIGQVAKLTDCKIPTIRWYEQQSLLPPAVRTTGNQRRYSEKHVTILRFVLHARALGFDLESVRQLLHLSQCSYHSPHEADEIARRHLTQVQARIKQLQSLESELECMINTCSQGQSHDCQVLTVLNDKHYKTIKK